MNDEKLFLKPQIIVQKNRTFMNMLIIDILINTIMYKVQLNLKV